MDSSQDDMSKSSQINGVKLTVLVAGMVRSSFLAFLFVSSQVSKTWCDDFCREPSFYRSRLAVAERGRISHRENSVNIL